MNRRAALILLCAAAFALAPFAALCFGRFPIAAGDALSALFPAVFGEIENAELTRGVLLNIRLPRVALAMLAGAGLAALPQSRWLGASSMKSYVANKSREYCFKRGIMETAAALWEEGFADGAEWTEI